MKTKYFLRNAVLAAMLLLPLTLAGCRYDLVEGPSMDMNEEKNAADYKDFILPPASLTATQGESKAVVLTWPAVKNAVQYQVFAAESPFSTFSKVSETTSTETEITIEEEAGITKYYCISAVNYYGTVSSKSVVAMGSTLAVPIITAIDASEEGNSVSVSWWMDNCSSETYADDVSFNVNVYALSAPNIKFQSLTVDGDTRQVEIGGLTSKTEYYFEVEVVKADSTSKECSEKTSAETAHRVIPDAPTNVTVSQGVTTDNITITWQLPEGAWYRENSGVSGFVLHPLYFKIYRKLASQSDDKYEVIATAYVESNTSWKYRNNNSDTSKPITVPVPAGAKTLTPAAATQTLDAPYETYIPGAEVSITDTTAVRGNKYTYYVQSITDDTPEGKTITADSSKSVTVDGWLISIPSFSIISNYEQQGDEFTNITFKYNLRFQNYDKLYTYFVKRVKEPLPTDTVHNSAEEKFTFQTMEALNSNIDSFRPVEDIDGEKYGYYIYTLYICNVGTNIDNCETENLLDKPIQANGKYLVTNDANAVPVIEDFAVTDGYNTKFNLTWKYNSEYHYYIHYKEVSGNTTGDEIVEEITPQQGWQNNTVVTYSHAASPGSRRIYWLEASQGIPSFAKLFTDETKTEEKVFETLGNPEPSFTTYDYNTITVTWPKVQKSNGIFTVSAKYDGENSELITDNNYVITEPTETEDYYKCVITNPDGYDDPTKSGKKIKFTVKTHNSDTNDESSGNPIDVCTVGPALVNLNISSSKSENNIVINWNAVEGARGYLIRRITYATSTQNPAGITNGDFIEYPDVYYYDAIDKTLITKNDDVVNAEVKTNYTDGTFKLIDTYIAAPDNNPGRYALNQSKISWGIPFGYLVIPVKENGGKNDFEFNMRSVGISNGATYKDSQNQLKGMEKFGATKGYGLNVHAKKSERGDLQEIEWDIPYDQSDLPGIYCREIDGEDSKWNYISYNNINPEHNAVSLKPESKSKAYEYLIAYGKPAEPIKPENIPTSFIEDDNIGLSRIDDTYPDYSDSTKNVPEEKANKGYLLWMDDPIKALETGDGFSEIVTMNTWNYDSKSIGPERAYVCIKNYNLSSEWNNVVLLNHELCFDNDVPTEDNTTVTSLNSEKTRIRLEPTIPMDGTLDNPITKGPLQVLRDAKHYYTVRLERGSTSVVIDSNKYAYRNVDKIELVKMALLNMSYGFYRDGGGKEDLSNIGSHFKYKGNGNLSLKNEEGVANFGSASRISSLSELGKFKATVNMNGYAPLQYNPAGEKTVAVKISMSNVEIRIKGDADRYLDKFRESFTVNVEPTDSNLPSSYKAKLDITCSGKDNLYVLIDGQEIVNTSSFDIRCIYFPLQIHSDNKYRFKDSYYGWWPENE